MTSAPRLCYQTIEIGKNDIHLCTLRDNQEFSDPDGIALDLGISSAAWPLFGIVWPSGIVLANYVLNYKTEGLRILEIGCGIALSSLLLNQRNADITATDYHPDVQFFLDRNALLNHGENIAFERLDWSDDNSTLGTFDLIIGSDLLYEDEHVSLLADFIQHHARQHCEVVIVDPGRGRKSKLSTKMVEHGFISAHIKPENTDFMEPVFKGHILRFSR